MSALGAAVGAEWVKLRSVRSTWLVLTVFTVVAAGLGWTAAGSFIGTETGYHPMAAYFLSLTMAQLVLIVFAVVAVGSEYSTGTIRSSLAAVPARGRFVAAKAAAVGSTAAAASLVALGLTFTVVWTRLGADRAPLEARAMTEALFGAWVHLTLLALFAMGVALLLRSTVVTLSVLLPVMFLTSQGLGNVPALRPVAQYLPDQVGMVIMRLTEPGDPMFGRDYGAWTGLGLLVLWTSASLLAGWIALRRRDG